MASNRTKYIFWAQLWAMLVRNMYLKKRDTRKTLAEILVPLYSLGVLILLKILLPNPNFPEITEPRGDAQLFKHFQQLSNHSIAVVADWEYENDTMAFLNEINQQLGRKADMRFINWIPFSSQDDLISEYNTNPESLPLAVIFHSNPMLSSERLSYTIRTNPSDTATPSTRQFYSSPALCREHIPSWTTGVLSIGGGDYCPVNQYYYSGFVSLQAIIDYTKMKLDMDQKSLPMPDVRLEMFPKKAFTGNWLLIFRIIIPIYMVMTLSQFITYLLMLVVGEKEKKIREGMRIMGLKDSVYWFSWFILYAIFVFILSIVCTVLLFTLKVFQHSSYVLIFLLTLLFGFTIISFAFMLTPFFDKARTAGILGSFAVNIMSALYFIQVFVSNADSLAFWFVSLISSSCFALAMDKALVLDMAGVGVTWDNLWSGPGIPFGGSLIMMALDTILYTLIAYYLDAVMPSEYGVKQKPWFCFSPSHWCGKNRSRISNVTSHFHVNGDSRNTNNKDIEPVPRELHDKEAIRIVSLQKTFRHCRRSEMKALDGIDLSIYEGQITAVLGHNGAGKSTLFNILTGLTAPSFGTAYVYGLDVRDPQDMNEIRQMTGVCPQHDILFDLLTVEQHLNFFAAIKGIPSNNITSEVKRALQDVSLTEKAHCFSKHLSGGQKRKLSVAIATIGDPKIIILDEPTAGVDPISRRHLWRILQRIRPGKVLLLTTHFMDEADILGDRKAVISKGKLRCAGSSLFLKNKFGIGYHLTLVLEGVCREHQITRLVRAHVPRAEKARRHGRELSYILPHNSAHHFAPLFAAIEGEIGNKTNRLGISSYGVSMTTLEEVFLHLEGEDEETGEPVDGISRKLVRARALSRSLSLQSKSPSYQELHDKENTTASANHHTLPLPEFKNNIGNNVNSNTLSTPTTSHALHSTGHGVEHVKIQNEVPTSLDILTEHIKVRPKMSQIFSALIWVRTIRMIRDPYKLYMMIIMPIICCAVGLYIKSHQIVFFRMQPLILDGLTYKNLTQIAIHNAGGDDLNLFVETLGMLGVNNIDRNFDGNFSSLLASEHFAAFNINSINFPEVSLVAMYNDTYMHSLPIVVNILNNALYRMSMQNVGLADTWVPIEVSTHPFQQTAQPEELNVGIIACAICMGMVFALVPVSLAVDIVYDREIKAKNQLRVNGLSLTMYYMTYFAVLSVIMLFITGALIVLIILNDLPSLRSVPALTVLVGLLIMYCPASILFSTSLSYIFDKMDSAQSIMPNITTWVGMIPFMLVAILDMFKWGNGWAFRLHILFSLFDTMYLPYAVIYYVDRVYITCRLRSNCIEPTLDKYSTPEIWWIVFSTLLHIPFWLCVLYTLDRLKSGAKCSQIFPFFKKKKKALDKTQLDIEFGNTSDHGEDDDVRKERRRAAAIITSTPPQQPVLVVHNLRKEYSTPGEGCFDNQMRTKQVALSRVSLAVDAGEVFGLLGHNGAGKTTTMKIVTAEVTPTYGSVMLGGHDVQTSSSEAFQMLGYCPQHDALWKNVTVKEHLECYAAIRGVPKPEVSRLVDAYLHGLQVAEHSSKHSDECSGGTRRKLSFAMAMIGLPRLVLLDEPSTGMDPRSKRFLWDTILASFQGKKGAILTTHSMEEADALCSRVGIMVKGGLRCIGSTQHLKNLYGAGYTLEMKLAAYNTTLSTESECTTDPQSLASPVPVISGETSPSLGEADEGSQNESPCEEETTAELADEPGPDASIHTPLVGHRSYPEQFDTPTRITKAIDENEIGSTTEAARLFVLGLFPTAVLEETFADRLVFSVPQHAVSSLAKCFQQLEAAKERLRIVEYSFSQTTLEQVFLKFAQNDASDAGSESIEH